MMPRNASRNENPGGIPSVDEILRTEACIAIERDLGRETALRSAREALANARESGLENGTRGDVLRAVEAELRKRHDVSVRKRLRRVVNATGVIIHTNLGRSPLSENAKRAIANATSYCNVELDLDSGNRGRRGAFAEQLVAEIAGAEEALIVNNCAAASLLTLSAIAKGGEVIVSRGELVEIGGDFRIPEVLEQSGSRLREVGTTNRTKLADYGRAISNETKAILRVHPSNYRISGFTETPKLEDLAMLALENDIVLFEDAGSGALIDLSPFGLGDEPVVSDSVRAGADIVAFSGDKLLGGIQAGFLVGKRDLIQKTRKHPLYRAVRADKIVYAAVEGTLGSFVRGSAFEDIPMLRMLSMRFEQIGQRSKALRSQVDSKSIRAELVQGESAIGGGAGTGVKLETMLIAIRHSNMSARELAFELRKADVPIIARIEDDNVLLDLRTVAEGDEHLIVEALEKIAPANDSSQQNPT